VGVNIHSVCGPVIPAVIVCRAIAQFHIEVADVSRIVYEIEKASKLPLNDAAFYLWLNRNSLDLHDKNYQQRTLDLADHDDLSKIVRSAMAKVLFDFDNAADGPTFYRLKEAHPESSDESLKLAVDLAVKLYRDCPKYYTYTVGGLADCQRAVDLARKDNPGFLESTYEAARNDMCFQLRQ
jgi:hypothetical protein